MRVGDAGAFEHALDTAVLAKAAVQRVHDRSPRRLALELIVQRQNAHRQAIAAYIDIDRFKDDGGTLAMFSMTTPLGDTTFRFVERRIHYK